MRRTRRSAARAALLAPLVVLLLLVLQARATPGTAAPPGTAGLLQGHGAVLIAHDHTMALRSVAGGAERTLFQLSSNEFVRAPVWLPGGGSFLYIDQKAFTGDRSVDYGGDIWQANADGSNRQLIWSHDAKGVDLDGLALAPDGRWLLFGYTRTELATNGGYLGQVVQLRRLDLGSKRTTVVAADAGNPAISPDGNSIVYLNLGASGADDFGLWIADRDGGGARPLVTVQQNLLAFFSPRFSPDGTSILFAGVENPDFPLWPAGRVPVRQRGLSASGVALADGPPQDIWVMHVDGTGLQQITTIFEDQPSAAWSADSSQALVMGSTGLYLVGADGSAISRLGDGYLHSQIAWLDR